MAPRNSAMEYTFTLKYQLTDDDRDSQTLVERLGEAGCDDALVGIGQPGGWRWNLPARRWMQMRQCAARWPMCAVPHPRPG